MPDGVAGPPDPDSLHHARVAELPTTQRAVEQHWFLELVGLDTADEEGLTVGEGLHEEVERFLKLSGEGGGALASLRAHPNIVREQQLQEGVGGDCDELEQVCAQRVAVLLEEPSRVVKHDTGEMTKTK